MILEQVKTVFRRIDAVANHLGSLAVFVSFMLAFCYFLFPDLRRYVEVTFTNREAWYRVGTLKPQTDKWGQYPGKDKNILNFYHVAWNVKSPITQSQTRKAINTVAVHSADFTVMGRAMESVSAPDKYKSNNPVISLSRKNDCIYVKELIFVDGTGEPVLEQTNKDTAYVWMRGIKVSCE